MPDANQQGFVTGVGASVRRGLLELSRRIQGLSDDIDTITSSTSTVDHGSLLGLSDDDHTQYAKTDGSRGDFDYIGSAAQAQTDAQAYADTQDDSHSTADRSYADTQDDSHSTADRSYADTQDDSHSTADRSYTDAEVATVQANLDAHEAQATGAHASTAISYVPPTDPIISAWLSDTNVHGALDTIAAQWYAPDDETLTALIDALNLLATGDEITNGDIFASDLIVARHILAGSVTGVHLNATTDITVGTGATTWKIVGTADEATTVIRTSDATSFGDADGVWLDASARFSLGDKLTFDATDLTVQGDITATGFDLQTAGGITVGSFDSSILYGYGGGGGFWGGGYSDPGLMMMNDLGTTTVGYLGWGDDGPLDVYLASSSVGGGSGGDVAYIGISGSDTARMFSTDEGGGGLGGGDLEATVETAGGTATIKSEEAGFGSSSIVVTSSVIDINGDLDMNSNDIIGVGSGSAAAPSISFTSDSDTGFFRPFANGIDVSAGGSAVWRWGSSTNHSYQKLWMNGNLIHLGGGALSDVGDSNFVGYIQMGSNAITQVGYLRVDEGSTTIPSVANQSDTNTGINFRSGGAVVDVVINGSTLGAWDATGVFFQKAYDSTTGNAASVFVNSNGRLYRSTSAKKYKDKIKPLTLAEAQKVVFGVEAVSYQSKCEDDDGRKRHVGIVADPMTDIDKRFVTFGDDGDVEGFVYERMPAPLAVVASDHEERLVLLEKALKGLAKVS